MLAGNVTLKAMEAGDVENALLACGQVVGLVRDIPTIKELVESIMSETTAVYEKLGKTLDKKR
jgi:nitronate monooxygenase